ncbi:hypothetical protein DFH09DRAFT_1092603 [Mycena vulgaris]|nr:hypothetical protein DFH09DRAFT_1092603 [Mycena vulgaris]
MALVISTTPRGGRLARIDGPVSRSESEIAVASLLDRFLIMVMYHTCTTGAATLNAHIPDSAERTHIRELLRSHSHPRLISSPKYPPSAKLTRLDVKIAALQQQLDQLSVQRAAVQSHYNDCQSILTPIRRLPSEILVEIFSLCVIPVPWDCTGNTWVMGQNRYPATDTFVHVGPHCQFGSGPQTVTEGSRLESRRLVLAHEGIDSLDGRTNEAFIVR